MKGSGQFQKAFSMSARTHLPSTQSQPSHPSVLQLRRDGVVDEEKERLSGEKQRERDGFSQQQQQQPVRALPAPVTKNRLASFQSFSTAGSFSNTSNTDFTSGAAQSMSSIGAHKADCEINKRY